MTMEKILTTCTARLPKLGHMETLLNMERERESFQSNQKEIVGKYEDQLGKSKQEVDSLKREVARLAVTFYKSTPTPKKDLEKQIEDLKKQNCDLSKKFEELQIDNLHKCNKEKSIQFQTTWNSQDKENIFEDEVKGISNESFGLTVPERSLRNRAKSACGEVKEPYDPYQSKSTCKTQPRRTRAPPVPAPVSLSLEDSVFDSDVQHEKPKKTTRKKLCYIEAAVSSFQGEDNELEPIQQESPRSMVKRTLRSKSKKEHSKCSSLPSGRSVSGSCVGCGVRKPSQRELFPPDRRTLQELNHKVLAPQQELDAQTRILKKLQKKKTNS